MIRQVRIRCLDVRLGGDGVLNDTPPLSEGEIHVWQASDDILMHSRLIDDSLLSASEKSRAEKFASSHHREQFMARRSLARRLLSGYSGQEPEAVDFEVAAAGKPFLAGADKTEDLNFNLSRSSGFFIMAVARKLNIGVDLERMKPLDDLDEFAALFLSDKELAMLPAADRTGRQDAVYALWTCKEALFKAAGTGLSDSIRQLTIGGIADGRPALIEVPEPFGEKNRWHLHAFSPWPGFAAALAWEC